MDLSTKKISFGKPAYDVTSERNERHSSKKNKKVKGKKSKKHKKKKSSSSSSESSENEWVEKNAKGDEEPSTSKSVQSTSQRDDWMTMSTLFPCVTREQLHAAKEPSKKQIEAEERKKMLDCPGQTGRELNPYWANGGTGLPPEAPSKSADTESTSYTLPATTGNSEWFKKALRRAKEQAEEEGRSLEEVAAERWGSLDKLKSLIAEADKRKSSNASDDRRRYDERRYDRDEKRYDRDDKRFDRDGKQDDRRFDRDGKQDDRRFDRVGKQDDRRFDRDEKQDDRRFDRDGKQDDRRYDRDGKQDDRRYDRHDRRNDRDYKRSDKREDKSEENERSYERDRRNSPPKFRRPNMDEEDRDRVSYRSRDDDMPSHSKTRFQKPGDFEMPRSIKSYRNLPSGSGNWRKKSEKPAEEQTPTKPRVVEEEKKPSPSPSPPPSSSSESDSEPETERKEEPQLLTDAQLNELAAKLVKAEILGNDSLATELKQKLESAREARKAQPAAAAAADKKRSGEEEVVILTRTDSKGFSRPLETKGASAEPYGGRRRKQKVSTHAADGQRDRYFPDDDKYSLKEMFQKEKATTVEDDRAMFARLAGKTKQQEHALDMDDIFAERARESASDGKIEARERDAAIRQHKRLTKILDNCQWCFDNKSSLRHLVVSIGSVSYVCLPSHQSLTDGHCLIVPIRHVPCATQADEDVWQEMQDFRKALVKMFDDRGDDCILFESAMYFNRQPHMVLNCVPLPRKGTDVDMAQFYFKKAIMECETEWTSNKKLVDLKGRDIRKAVPKGLPYFAVDFGMENGFAHVIEDEKMFPTNFAEEIIGGMLELDHHLWRKPRRESFEVSTKKVNAFIKEWTPYDITKKGKKRKKEEKEEPRSRSSTSASSDSD